MANRMKSIRESKGLSVSELARRSKVTRQTIHRLENDEVNSANSKTLMRIADALDVKVTDFFAE